MNKPPKIIIITGPCGVGKTTVANILRNSVEVELINGDKIKDALFPKVDNITEHPKKLQKIKEYIYALSKEYFVNNQSVIIDYVILGEVYIERFQNTFKENLIIKVLLPPKKVIFQRDQNRACWTSGQEMIDKLYQKYIGLKTLIGNENYINNAPETPEETAQNILKSISF